MNRYSGLQKDVFSLYRSILRSAKEKEKILGQKGAIIPVGKNVEYLIFLF